MTARIAPEDLTWLLMDRPNNLMHVNGLLGFDTLPDTEVFRELIMDRLVRKYRVLSQRPIIERDVWKWEDDPDFAIEHHVRRVVLDDAGDDAVRAYVSEHFSLPFDRARPLWEMQLLSGPDDDGGYLYSRFHHGIADGIRLVQLLLGACDPAPGAMPPTVGRNTGGEHAHPLERVMHLVETSVSDTLEYMGQAGQVVVGAVRRLMATTNPFALANHIGDAIDVVRDPVTLVDALTGIAPADNEVSNSWREITRMLLSDGHETGAWSGEAGVDKSVAWVEGVPLDGIRTAARAYGATVNDVLISGISLAMTAYLAEHGVTDVEDISWMMPVSLQPVDAALPARLGNHFVVVMLSMPLGITDPEDLVAEMNLRTTRLKNSAGPFAAFGVQRLIAETPEVVARRVTDFFAGKTVGQLTNVPGPRVAMQMAGADIRSILGWVPMSGDQPLGVCLMSYDGSVNVGVATDSRMIPDPGHLAELIERSLHRLARAGRTAAGIS